MRKQISTAAGDRGFYTLSDTARGNNRKITVHYANYTKVVFEQGTGCIKTLATFVLAELVRQVVELKEERLL